MAVPDSNILILSDSQLSSYDYDEQNIYITDYHVERKNVIVIPKTADLRQVLQRASCEYPGRKILVLATMRYYGYLCRRSFIKYEDKMSEDKVISGDEVMSEDKVMDGSSESDFQHPEEAYLNLLRKILNEGDKRPDRTGVGTLSLFAQRMEFDLEKGFPLITTKRVWFKAIVEELLFFISGKTNTKILEATGINIWKGNTSAEFLASRKLEYAEGDMGPGYSFQWRHAGAPYSGCNETYSGMGVDQLSKLIDGLKADPYGRRHIVSAWNVADIDKMALPPCHILYQFYVSDGHLDCMFYQRSADMFLGVPFNIASYALLTIIIGRLTGYRPRRLIAELGDAHIYLNHIEQVKEQLDRSPYLLPTVILDERIDINSSIDDIRSTDIKLEGYSSWPAIKAEMAV